MSIDLSKLAAPAVVEELNFEALLADAKNRLIAIHPAAAEVLALESEPLTKLLESHAYRELLFRQRVNTAARAHLVAFATDTDLDHKAAFYNLPRMSGEQDARFRQRILLRARALAGNGTREHYEGLAMATSLNVRHAVATQPQPGHVRVVLQLQDASAAADTVAAVDAALNAENARPIGVPVTVAAGVAKPIDITARIWREASAPSTLVAQLAAALPAAIDAYALLGRAMPRSWVTLQLHANGVAAVRYVSDTTPAETTHLATDEYPVAGTIDLQDQGVMGTSA